jgi:hypothetical protein
MKNQRRFKAPNYSRGCLLAKAFGVSVAIHIRKFEICNYLEFIEKGAEVYVKA